MIIALQHQPELLILDEPTSGLDPLVQQTFFVTLRECVADGATVFLSSHILSEVEKGADRVAIIRDGRIVQDSTPSRGCATWPTTRSRSASPATGARPPSSRTLPGVSDVVADDHVLRLRVVGAITPVVQAAAHYELLDFVSREPSLEETFLAQYGREAAEVK